MRFNLVQVIIALIVSLTIAKAFGESLFLEHQRWQKLDGLPHQMVYSISEDSNGYIWIGTMRGLSRFDGTTFEKYGKQYQLPERSIATLYSDSQNHLWVSFDKGDLFLKTNGKFEPYPLLKNKEHRIVSFEEDNQNCIWAMEEVSGNLHRLSDSLVIPLQSVASRRDWSREQILCDSAGRLWALFGGNLYSIENDQTQLVPRWKDTIVLSIAKRSKGGIWIETHDQITGFNHGQTHEVFDNEEVILSRPHYITELDPNHLVAGCMLNGAYILNPDGSYRHIEENTIGNGSVIMLSSDSSGNVWLATRNSGLTRMGKSNHDYIPSPQEFSSSPIRTITQQNNEHSTWIGTAGNGLFDVGPNGWKQMKVLPEIEQGHLTSLLEDSQNRLWCGFWGQGIFVKEESGEIHSISRSLTKREKVSSIIETDDGTTWAATSNGLMRYKKGKTKWFDESNGLPTSFTQLLLEDHEGKIWFTMKNYGLGYIKGNQIKLDPIPSFNTNKNIHSIAIDREHRIWISSYDERLVYFQDGKIINVETDSEVGTITNIHIDTNDQIWMTNFDTVFKLKNGRVETFAKFEKYPKTQFTGEFMNTITEDSTTLRIAAWGGIIRINKHDGDESTKAIPTPIFDSFEVNEDKLDLRYADHDSSIELPPSSQNFNFKFSSPYFSISEELKYRVKLEPSNHAWTEIGENKFFNINFLSPGKYVFLAQAYTDLQSSESARFEFTVLPEWWQKKWVQVLVLIFVALLIISFTVGVSTRHHNKEKVKLRRLSAIEKERTRIAQDLHDDIGSSLIRISMTCQHLTSLSDSNTTPFIENIQKANNRILQKMHEIIRAVSPQNDGLSTVVQYLELHAIDFLRDSGIKLNLVIDKQFPEIQVPSEIRHNIYLSFKETLSNVIKHSQATVVNITIQWSSSKLKIEIDDNGVGMSKDSIENGTRAQTPSERGNGLSGIRARMDDIGGTLIIHCSKKPSPKTRITLETTLKSSHEQ